MQKQVVARRRVDHLEDIGRLGGVEMVGVGGGGMEVGALVVVGGVHFTRVSGVAGVFFTVVRE